MNLPDKFDVILCDGVREEKRKKLTIFGLYAGNDVIVGKEVPIEDINLALTFLIRFHDGNGDWSVGWKIVDSAGNLLTPEPPPDAKLNKRKDSTAMVIIQVVPHKVKKFGTHKFVFSIDRKDYVFEYEIKQGELEP